MFCTKCGKEVNNGSITCPYCGNNLAGLAQQLNIDNQTVNNTNMTGSAQNNTFAPNNSGVGYVQKNTAYAAPAASGTNMMWFILLCIAVNVIEIIWEIVLSNTSLRANLVYYVFYLLKIVSFGFVLALSGIVKSDKSTRFIGFMISLAVVLERIIIIRSFGFYEEYTLHNFFGYSYIILCSFFLALLIFKKDDK